MWPIQAAATTRCMSKDLNQHLVHKKTPPHRIVGSAENALSKATVQQHPKKLA